jgi:hypothetical protein
MKYKIENSGGMDGPFVLQPGETATVTMMIVAKKESSK